MSPHRWKGFSLPEALTVLAVACALIAAAAPSFALARREAALTATVNQLLGALHFARSAAILRNTPTIICLSANGRQCADSANVNSAKGWLVLESAGSRAVGGAGNSNLPLRRADLPENVAVHGSRALLTFWPTARAGTSGTFVLCSRRSPISARKVVVSQTGRPRVADAHTEDCAP